MSLRYKLRREYTELMLAGGPAATRLKLLLPHGAAAYSDLDLEACIRRAKAAATVAAIPEDPERMGSLPWVRRLLWPE